MPIERSRPSVIRGTSESDLRPSLRDALRQATATVHHRLETRLPLTSDTLTATGYRRLLEAFYGYYLPLEEALAADAECIPELDWSSRRKAPRLAADLLALGLEGADLATLPSCPYVPQTDHRAATLGCLYVVEGATLGGQVTGRAIAGRLGFSATHGAGFLQPYGEETGRRWRRFLAILQLADPQPASFHARASVAAVDTFAGLERWLEERGALV